jgi:hypothetical protein
LGGKKLSDPGQRASSPFPWLVGGKVLWDAVRLRPRSFQQDAIKCIDLLSPPPKYIDVENITHSDPGLFVVNHYSRPGFGAWWIGIGLGAVLPEKTHWMMTSGWTHTGVLNPATRWLFPRLAEIYSFTPTPPMPPTPSEIGGRAKAVRMMLRTAKETDHHIVIAPEGRDHPMGILGEPPPGIGRFLIQLTKYRERIIPVGVYEDVEEGHTLSFRFGPAFHLDIPKELTSKGRDQLASKRVMKAIAQQLPTRLRGAYR